MKCRILIHMNFQQGDLLFFCICTISHNMPVEIPYLYDTLFQEKGCTCTVTISRLVDDHGWWFPSCPHATYATSLARLMAQITHAMNVARLTSSHISKPSYRFFTPLLHILYSNFGFLPSIQHIFVSKF